MKGDLPARQVRAKAELGRYLTRRERQCVFKRAHTEHSAVQEAKRLHALGEDRIRAYRCDQCGEWHVGRTKL